jgi:hypothetical protein
MKVTKEQRKLYRQNEINLLGIEHIRKRSREYYALHKEKIVHQNALLNKKYPWRQIYNRIRSRTLNKKMQNYSRYGGAGILLLMSQDDVKNLWIRDNAGHMKKPTIHRIDKNGHYCFSNCKFIEAEKHAELDHGIPVKAISIDGQEFLFKSYADAKRTIGARQSEIMRCVRNPRNTHRGYRWERI